MGKRGPKPLPKNEASHVFSTRVQPELWKQLQRAAKESRRPISREVHARLVKSFTDDDNIREKFGSRRNYALMRVVAGVINVLSPGDPERDWMDDPKTFSQVRDAVINIFKVLEPVGTESIEKTFDARHRGAFAALNTMGAIAMADAETSRNATREDWLKSQLRADLGDAVLRHFYTDPEGQK
jgi:hypothetical protein